MPTRSRDFAPHRYDRRVCAASRSTVRATAVPILTIPPILPILLILGLAAGGCVSMRPVETARAALPAPRLVATEAGEVYVEIRGDDDAPTLVLVHGFGGSLYSWREVVPALADAGYRVIALDLPGFGYSARPQDAAAYTPPGQATSVAEVLETLGVGPEAPAHLVGHSFGGGVALKLAEERPELVRSLVLVDSTLPTFSRAPNADWPLYRPFAYLVARTVGPQGGRLVRPRASPVGLRRRDMGPVRRSVSTGEHFDLQ